MTSMTGDQIGGIVRAVAAAVGGYLVGKGVIDEQTAAAVSGAVVTIAVAAWSVWSKKKAVE
jgi:hypothetical protein